jgi:hypothetical protein
MFDDEVVSDERITCASDDILLERAVNDPDQSYQRAAVEEILRRKALRAAAIEEHRKILERNPFDPRREVSADAKYIAGRIVINLWILFLLLLTIVGTIAVAMVRSAR